MAVRSKSMPRCPLCGSKQVKEENGHYRCLDCKGDFGRKAITDEGESLVDRMQSLRFNYGYSEKGQAHLRIVGNDKECLFEVYHSEDGGVDKVADVISEKDWIAFKKRIFEKCFIEDWDKVYIPKNDGKTVSDNMEWRLGFAEEDGDEHLFSGYGAYPVYWKEFLDAVDPFFKRLKNK